MLTMDPMKQAARPVRDHLLRVRVTAIEAQRLVERALAQDVSVSHLVRLGVRHELGAEPAAATERETVSA
jgi:hypothetical protein